MSIDKDFYNSSSAAKLGWDPSWFGCDEFDYELVKAIQKWQKNNGLTADGLVGPTTYRRIWTERESNIHDYVPKNIRFGSEQKYIVHNSKFIPIKWDKVILWEEPEGLKAKPGCYTDYSGKPDRTPTMFVNHWDVCLSSESCARVLNNRGISIHFCIDNDGTIYQMLDTQHKAWHAGIKDGVGGNANGIGVEIANAYYPKYQNWYVKNGFGERPIVKGAVVHGKTLDPFLDFYPVQVEALKALWKACSEGIGIPLSYPSNNDGTLSKGVHSDCVNGTFKGICNHYNFTKTKLDCANLDLKELLSDM